ncbi:hypothetical protein JG687_00010799 [Phytophthora cactorum]|uniref:Uncharacterized protein n=1 Tax=Phytophthora cactorum TaxID=29920 RepID=A0A8T1U6A6_9STRA|nr:hypothetical protein JG687_00010799 [Phytophthora cactorum]
MPRSRKKKRDLSPTSSPPSQPLTRSSTSATRPEAELSMSVVDSSSLLQPALGGAAATSAFTVPPDDNPFVAFAAPTLRLLDDSNSTQQTSRRSKPKLSPGTLVFHADTMTYDFANMVPHTCRNYGENSAIAQATDDSACLNVVDEMKEFVDKIVEETDNGATKS